MQKLLLCEGCGVRPVDSPSTWKFGRFCIWDSVVGHPASDVRLSSADGHRKLATWPVPRGTEYTWGRAFHQPFTRVRGQPSVFSMLLVDSHGGCRSAEVGYVGLAANDQHPAEKHPALPFGWFHRETDAHCCPQEMVSSLANPNLCFGEWFM